MQYAECPGATGIARGWHRGVSSMRPEYTHALMARFWAKVDATGDCWIWNGYTNQNGYGRFSVDGRMIVAHRVAYTALVGAVPDGLCLDHLCRVRHCVNPDHLDPVLGQVNSRRGYGLPAKNARKTKCPAGHLYSTENTIVTKKGSRRCRLCLTSVAKRRYQREISTPESLEAVRAARRESYHRNKHRHDRRVKRPS